MAECAICCEAFDSNARAPLVLKCGHTFCKSCLARGSYCGVVRCYNCSAVDGRAVDSLPKNFALLDAGEQRQQRLPPGAGMVQQLAALGLKAFLLDPDALQLTNVTLGSGGSGTVVKGLLNNQDVAVKVVELADVPAHTQQALQRETAIALQLAGNCHHCCQYRGACIKDGAFCLVMRLYNSSLMRLISQAGRGGLPLPSLLRYGGQAAAALAELHSMGVLVLDLKPQNLLLDSNLDEVVVADFGLGQVMSHTIGGFRPTNASIAGTLNYMAPEQFAADTDDDDDEAHSSPGSGSSSSQQHREQQQPLLTPAADVWAWACTLLHMATGIVPHAGLKLPQITMKVGMRKRGPAVPHDLPGPLRELLLRCLAGEPQQRPSAQELVQEVQALQSLSLSQLGPSAASQAASSNNEVLRVIYAPNRSIGSGVMAFSLPWNPFELFGRLLQQLAKRVGEDLGSLPAVCSVDFGQQLGFAHFKSTLHELGWQPNCLLALGDLDEEEVEMCARPDTPHDSDGLTQLHHWICHGNLRKVQLLMAAGADPNFRNDQHYTSLLKKAIHCKMDIAHYLLDHHGPKLLPNVLAQGIEEGILFKAWPLLDKITQLLERHPLRQAFHGELHAVLDSSKAMRCIPQLLRRLAAAGVQWQMAPGLVSAADEPTLRLALQLDPSCVSRTSWLNDQSYKRQGWQGWSALHEVCGVRCPWSGCAPPDLARVALFVSSASNVDPVHEKLGVLDYDRKWCEHAMGHDGCQGLNYKYHASQQTPLHIVVCLAMDYASRHTRQGGHYCLRVDDDVPFYEGPGAAATASSYAWRGWAPCSYAQRVALAAQWLPVATVLVQAGADVSKPDRWGQSPYQMLKAALLRRLQASAGSPDKGRALQQVMQRWVMLFKQPVQQAQVAAAAAGGGQQLGDAG